MSVIAAAVRELMAAGLQGEFLIAAIERIEAAQKTSETETVRQARNRRYYETKRLKPSEKRLNSESDESVLKPSKTVLKHLKSDASRVEDITLSTEISGKEERKIFSSKLTFDAFWLAYPKKVGKGDARRKFDLAVHKITGPDPPGVLMAALARIKPTWTDPQFIPHPATWLHQERWEDGEAVRVFTEQKRNPEEQAEYDRKWNEYVERQARRQDEAEFTVDGFGGPLESDGVARSSDVRGQLSVGRQANRKASFPPHGNGLSAIEG